MTNDKLLYIGECIKGSTSARRYSILSERFKGLAVGIDFNDYLSPSSVLRSLQWRLQSPMVLNQFNEKVRRIAGSQEWEMIWVDKGMFMSERTFRTLRNHSEKIVFFTPDCLFHANGHPSIHKSLKLFDIVCTTKSFEHSHYANYMAVEKICQITQGYTQLDLEESRRQKRWRPVGFVGKFERHRGSVVQALLDQGLEVHVAGAGWGRFKSVCDNDNLVYLGEALWEKEYQQFYQDTLIGLGLLSKEFPELHTTRTFEIPYFGALLATERNQETEVFFDEDSALMYKGVSQLVRGIQEFLADREKLRAIAMQGNQRVITQRLSWADQIETVLSTLDRL